MLQRTIWSKRMTKLAEELYGRGLRFADMALQLGVPLRALRDHVQRHRGHGRFARRLPSIRARRWSESEIALMRSLYVAKKTRTEIADALARTTTSVNSKILELQSAGIFPRRNINVRLALPGIEEDLGRRTIEEIALKHGRKRSTFKDHLTRYGLRSAPRVRGRHEQRLRLVHDRLLAAFPEERRRGESLATDIDAVLTGCLLGDATVSSAGAFDIIHSANGGRSQAEWALVKYFALWAADIPARITLKRTRDRTRRSTYVGIRVSSLQTDAFRALYQRWHPEARKVLPRDLRLNDIAVAVWFADDGYNQRGQIGFATHGFAEREVQRLAAALASQYKIRFDAPRLHRKSKRLFLLSRDSRSPLHLLGHVKPHLDGMGCIRHKLDHRARPDTSRSREIVAELSRN